MTEPEIRTIFRMLDTPYSLGYNVVDGMGTLSASCDVAASSQGAAKTQILAAITALDGYTATVVSDLVSQYDNIKTKVGSIQGGIGDLQGVTYSFDDKRRLLSQNLQTYLPYYKQHEVLARQMGNSGGININVIR